MILSVPYGAIIVRRKQGQAQRGLEQCLALSR